MGGGALSPRTKAEVALVPTWVDCALSSASGIASACCAAPFILTVDRAVTENSAGKSSLGAALARGLKQVFTRPHVVLTSLPYWMVAGVYGSTYVAANCIDAVCEHNLDPDAESSAFRHRWGKLFGVTVVNMGAGVAKDAAFARMFGAGGAKPPPVPPVSYALFAGRDLLTIAAGFILPSMLAQGLVASGRMDESAAGKSAQLLSPIGMQVVLTPVHLLALNMYNVPEATLGQRASQLSGLIPSSTLARMGRFGCAYGIGGIMNTELTNRARVWAVQQYS